MTPPNNSKPRFRWFVGSGPDLEFNLEALRERATENEQVIDRLIGEIPGAEAPRFRGERLRGFVFDDDRANGDWADAGTGSDGRPIFRPDRRTDQGRQLTERMRGLHVPGRLSRLQLVGLDTWRVEAGGRIYPAQCREFDDQIVFRVPETAERRFGEHPWLKEITRAQYHEIAARAAREEEREAAPG